MLEEQFVLYSLLSPNGNKVADHVTFLHTGYTVHWCIHDVSNKQNLLLLNT